MVQGSDPPIPHKPRRVRAKALAKKREILQAASRVFRSKGLHASGMRDIAAELGMQVGNLYYYFDNRQELLAFVQRDALSGLRQLAAWAHGQDLSAAGKLYLMVRGHVLCLNEWTPGSLAHLEIEALEGRWRERIQAWRDDYEAALRRVIVEGIEAGEFREVDAKTATLAILGAVNWTVKWFRPGGAKSIQDIADAFAEQMVRGLLADGAEFQPPDITIPNFAAPEPTGFT